MYRPRGERGATLLDAIVGTALMLVVFVGIVGAFRLTVIVVTNNKARAGAIALANERLEYVRSLAYDSIGTSGGIPAGDIAQEEIVSLNDVSYTRRTFISYEDDPGDGTGGADSNGVVTDYKAAKVTVSWQAREGEHTVTLSTRVSPPTGVETGVPGGTLAISVRNADSDPVSNAQVRIINDDVDPAVDLTTFTNAAGNATILGAPPGANYQIIVTKPGYSTAQTYDTTAENTNPNPANLGVALDETTAATFDIDLLSTKTIQTFTPVTSGTTTDTFATESFIASSTNITVISGIARLTALFGTYPAEGAFQTITVSTSSLVQWKTFSWSASEPAGTNISFQIYDGSGVAPIPDAQIPGNSTGLTTSPIDLSNVSTTTYGGLVVRGVLTTSDASTTPTLDSWSLGMEAGPHPLADVALTLRGAKTIGSGPGGTIYKYDNQALSSGSSGSVTISDLEFDIYTAAASTTSEYTVSSACGAQPEALGANASQTTQLFFSPATTNSLLIDVRTTEGNALVGADVRLYRTSPAYNTTIESDACGHAFFGGIAAGTGSSEYSIEVSASGYETYTSTQVVVSGTSQLSVILNAQ